MFVLTLVELLLLFFGVASIVLTFCPFMRSPGAIGKALAVVFAVLAIAHVKTQGWPKSLPTQRVAEQTRPTSAWESAEDDAPCVFEAIKRAAFTHIDGDKQMPGLLLGECYSRPCSSCGRRCYSPRPQTAVAKSR
jgi:hypothetical protein